MFNNIFHVSVIYKHHIHSQNLYQYNTAKLLKDKTVVNEVLCNKKKYYKEYEFSF